MKIVCLVADDVHTSGLIAEHGVSFYLETASYKMLIDMGASGAFIANSEKLGTDYF